MKPRSLLFTLLLALTLPSVALAQDDSVDPSAATNRVVIGCDEILISESIAFATGTDGVVAESVPLLSELAEALNEATWIHQVQVEGHTDSRGGAEFNERISHERAKAVAEHLSRLGVAPTRLTFVGYGETRPIDSNQTAEGREHNRRISFTIIERDECPVDTGTPVE